MEQKRTASMEDVIRKSHEIKAQAQGHQPGLEHEMRPQPEYRPFYPGVQKFKDQVALISGGDSGIGRATALAFANEGALVAIIYKEEEEDAQETKRLIEQEYDSHCLLLAGDVGDKNFCTIAVEKTVETFGRLDVLVNNAAEQHVKEDLQDISEAQLINTFRTNIFSQFFLCQAALNHIPDGSGSIINNASINAYKGNPQLMDYTATKGAIIAFTRSLSLALADRGIRVNAVAPGPIWTPLIPSSFDEEKVENFGKNYPLGRPAQPNEVAGCFTWLASKEASFVTGQVLHPNGGKIINS
jgi:NAD(P)-dependent dehydrogenase (short-subunit alcohol dehydrogenase family)